MILMFGGVLFGLGCLCEIVLMLMKCVWVSSGSVLVIMCVVLCLLF